MAKVDEGLISFKNLVCSVVVKRNIANLKGINCTFDRVYFKFSTENCKDAELIINILDGICARDVIVREIENNAIRNKLKEYVEIVYPQWKLVDHHEAHYNMLV